MIWRLEKNLFIKKHRPKSSPEKAYKLHNINVMNDVIINAVKTNINIYFKRYLYQ